MNDEQILEYIRNNIVDLAFKDNNNCIRFIDLLVEKDMVPVGIKDAYYNKHHITFHHIFSKKPERICMQGCMATEKPLVYYEDLFVDKYVVELL